MKKALTIMLILLFSLALIPLAFSGAKKEVVNVGTLMAHTGDLKEFGDNIRKGIALAAMQMGDAGLTIKLFETLY